MTAGPVDLSICAQEPIHIPGSIQPHGVLLALDETDHTVVQHSANLELIGIPDASIAGKSLKEILGAEEGASLINALRMLPPGEPVYLRNVHTAGNRNFAVSAHVVNKAIVLEMEPTESDSDLSFRQLYPLIQSFLSRLKTTPGIEELGQLAVDHVRSITGFDRVLLYKFDSGWNGHVLAESRTDYYSSYLDLWFPASDIPEQARRLYKLNRFRSIVDAGYRPVPIVPVLNPRTGAPLDLTFSTLRSVSPVHIEYLKNMDVTASMSISILTQDMELWGLIACHHRSPKHLPVEVRTACDTLAHTLAVQLQASEERAEYRKRIELASQTGKLLEFMSSEENFLTGLLNHPHELLSYMSASGLATVNEGECTLVGETPTCEEVRELVQWLIQSGRAELYETSQLGVEFAPARGYAEKASGVLAIPISQIHGSYILWFRPEVIQTVKWGGDPSKAVERDGAGGPARLHPRKSFEAWSETVRGRSARWSETEVEAAKQLRNAVVGIVLRKAEELAAISAELQRSNSELAAFSYSVSHDLRAPFRHIVGYSELLRKSKAAQLDERDLRYVNTIIESAQFAGSLVDNLLSFSQVGRANLQLRRVDMGAMVTDVKRDLELDYAGREIEWRIGDLPVVQADHGMMRMVWQNLLHNAIKYTRQQAKPVIEISSTEDETEYCFRIRDNGIGFDQAYADKLFGVFQRLHRMEDFEGTGIGLANVRRIASRHGGRAWGEGEVDKGATFYFTLPCKPSAKGQTPKFG